MGGVVRLTVVEAYNALHSITNELNHLADGFLAVDSGLGPALAGTVPFVNGALDPSELAYVSPERWDVAVLFHPAHGRNEEPLGAAETLAVPHVTTVLCIEKEAFLEFAPWFSRAGPVNGMDSQFSGKLPALVWDGVFLGPRDAAGEGVTDPRPSAAIAALGIAAVVNISSYSGNLARMQDDNDHYLRVDDVLDDSDHAEALRAVLPSAVRFIVSAVDRGDCVLVHCDQGKSRSASLVIAWLMRAHGLGYDEALAHVKSCRSIAQPNQAFERVLRSGF